MVEWVLGRRAPSIGYRPIDGAIFRSCAAVTAGAAALPEFCVCQYDPIQIPFYFLLTCGLPLR